MEDRAGVTWRADLSFFPPSLLLSLARPGIYPTLLLRARGHLSCVCVCTKKMYYTYTRSSTNHRDTRPTFLRLSLNIQATKGCWRPRGCWCTWLEDDDLSFTLLLDPGWMDGN